MGGGGKGASGSSSALAHIANAFFQQTTPLRHELTSQMEEALKTGGIGARIPIITRAVESSKRATSSALRGTGEELARTGLRGTPFGENIMAGTRMEGELRTSQIPTDMVAQFLTQIPNFVLGAANTAITGLSGAAGAQAQGAMAGPAWLNAILSPFSFGFSRGGGG